MEVRVFFWAPIQTQGYDLEFHKNPRKRVFAFLALEKTNSTRPDKHLPFPQSASEKQYRLSLLQVFAMRQ
ncbi:hypothetical protein QMK49_19890 [Pseudomonas sp. P8_250]|uniref:hypothetical protein n=1 Tax=unclassified Pseudomonas TaxID=196821 RepID=UPI0011AF1D18|nr:MULTISPECIES: hypothetical protein [unclassified Pseudomonas]MDX9672504.1 hypothetical protein [Pseudomonas sp. P8_250]WPN33550.1 hypothetical protein QMK53_15160 [Pseudomonas sp. P8_139]WPN39264.1 hypothetical protein QMK55_16215 [Pseudomonas sp. P8_229]